MGKSERASGAHRTAEFISEVFNEAGKLGMSEEQVYDAMKTDSGLAKEVVNFIKQKSDNAERYKNGILARISGDERIVIDAVDGSETLRDAKDVFVTIDPDFINWGINKKGRATPETPVSVYEMRKNATFAQMFDSLNSDMRKLCFANQHQIKNFVQKHRNWLRTEGCGTLFLFKENGNFFVARVRLVSGSLLEVSVHGFWHGHIWDAEDRHRIVVPKLAQILNP